jgi:hypothetical protein
MKCPKCGTEHEEGLLCCQNCGEKVDGSGDKPKKKRLIGCWGWATIFAIISLYCMIKIPDIDWHRDRNSEMFSSCLESLRSLKVAEEMYITDNIAYTDVPDRLAMYLVHGCTDSNGADCKGKVISRVESSCKPKTVKIYIKNNGLVLKFSEEQKTVQNV